jgi:aspartate carbamoyltransferase regulatory subunit
MQLYHMLGIDKLDCCVAVIQNVASRQMGKKDMIKIDASISINLDVIGYVDPGATVNVIRDSALVEKKSIPMPETLTNVIKCKNPRCITSVEQELVHVFKLTDKENKVYRCLYCESKPN